MRINMFRLSKYAVIHVFRQGCKHSLTLAIHGYWGSGSVISDPHKYKCFFLCDRKQTYRVGDLLQWYNFLSPNHWKTTLSKKLKTACTVSRLAGFWWLKGSKKKICDQPRRGPPSQQRESIFPKSRDKIRVFCGPEVWATSSILRASSGKLTKHWIMEMSLKVHRAGGY